VQLVQSLGQILDLIEHDICSLAFAIGVVTPLISILPSVLQIVA
jgi:hypothetical protein